MWQAFKLLPGASKLALLGTIIAAILLIIGSTSYVAYNKGLNVSKVQIEKYKTKSATLQAKLNERQSGVNEHVLVQYVDRNIYLDRVVTKTQTVVRDAVPVQFKFSKGWIYSYNQSVKGLPVDPVLAADASSASVTDVDALADTIVPNNGKCLANQNQLDQLQQWITETEKARAETVKE